VVKWEEGAQQSAVKLPGGIAWRRSPEINEDCGLDYTEKVA